LKPLARITIYFVGKPRDEHANALAAEFLKRTSRWAAAEMREIAAGTKDPWAKHSTAWKVALDPAGKQVDSETFAASFAECDRAGREAVFLIGGHAGLEPPWKEKADLLLSLSRMTFPHELARAMLAEQIYRAYAILRGHPYPR
jgi:23S rRNA (pseudouridine1915-N3)-methyltransferase